MSAQSPDYSNYDKSAAIYDAYIPKADYVAAADRLHALIQQQHSSAQTLLDVGCGSGRHLEQLRTRYRCQGLDRQAAFLDIARKRCPGLTFHEGDMADFDLGETFDVVTCLFVAIAYVKTVERLRLAVRCMARHLNPGGLLVFEPWVYPHKFWLNKLTADFIEHDELKISRMFITRREGNISVYDVHYLVGKPDGIEYYIEREELGLFTNDEYTSAIQDAGLEPAYDPSGGLFGDAHNIGVYTGKSRQ